MTASRPSRWLLAGLVACGGPEADPPASTPAPIPASAYRTPLRRLTVVELEEAVADLLGEAAPVASRLPDDGIASGYDNQASALVASDLFVERLEAVAGELADLALATVHVEVPRQRTTIASLGLPFGAPWDVPSSPEPFWLVWGEVPDVEVEVVASADGVYVVEAELFTILMFSVVPARVRLVVDGEPGEPVTIDAIAASPRTTSWTVPLTAGTHRLGLRLVDPRPSDDVVTPDDDVVRFAAQPTIGVQAITVTGPLDPAEGTPTPLRARLLACEVAGASVEGRRACAESALGALAARAWRRPVTNPELQRLLRFVDGAEAEGRGWDAGVRDAFAAVLLSPWFVYRVEGTGPGSADGLRPLTPHELATRLAFLVGDAPPDDALRACADAGTLGEADGPCALAVQLDRLLAEPRAVALAHRFGRQWIGLAPVPGDGALAPDATARLLEAVLLDRDAPVAALLRPTLAGLPDDGRPGGVLALPEVLAATSVGARTSVVKRGVLVASRLRCDPPSPPPPDVPALEATLAPNPLAQLEAHRADPVCAGCHADIDPYGLLLEGYAADGTVRAAWADGTPIPATVTLPGGRTVTGVDGLVDVLVADGALVRCAAEQLATWTWAAPRDPVVVDGIAAAAIEGGGTFRALLHAVVAHPTFRAVPEAP